MIEVNGQPIEWREGLTVSDVLAACKYSFPLIIVRIGDEIVPRAEYGARKVPDGSRVSVIHLMSGG